MTIFSQSAMADEPTKHAAKNLDVALATDRRFPANVFQGQWDAFLFFDPDLLFEPQSVERFKALLALENGSTVCMRNLDIPFTAGNPEQASIFLNKEVTDEAYMGRLQGTGVGSGWLYRMDRYGYASDAGNWCIYCERNNEIAVIAVRQYGASARLVTALESFGALPITHAIEKPVSYGLSSPGLPEDWRNKLLKEYA